MSVNLQLHLTKDLLQNLLRALPVAQEFRYSRDEIHLFLELRDDFLRTVGHELNNVSAGLTHRIVFVHEDSQRHNRRNLFAQIIVIREVLGNLAGLDVHLTHVRFLETDVLNDDQASLANRSSYVEVSEHVRRQDNFRVCDISLDGAIRTGCDGDAAQRAVSLELDRQEILLILHHGAHHEPRCHCASQGCRGHGA